MAFIERRALRVLDLESCVVRTVKSAGAGPPVRMSADGRWIGFGAARVVSLRGGGGVARRPLGRVDAGGWAWSPRGALLAAVTSRAGLVVGGPRRPARRLLADGWGSTGIAFAPSGRLIAVARSLYPRADAKAANWHQELWLIDVRDATRRLIYRRRHGLAPPELAGFSPDGRRLVFWSITQSSGSLRADGLPLSTIRTFPGARPRRLATTLVFEDTPSWCANELIVSAGSFRVATTGNAIVAYRPSGRPRPLSRDRSRSWVAPACATDRRQVAAAAGTTTPNTPFGQEHRAIWLLGRAFAPPAHRSPRGRQRRAAALLA